MLNTSALKRIAAVLGLFILLALDKPIMAQQLVHKHYGTLEGLPSNTVYFILQDQSKFIWFATDGGVCRFDGNQFITYTVEDGLGDNEVFSMYQDSQGRIWFLPFSGGLSYYYNGEIFSAINDSLLAEIQPSSILNLPYADRYGNLYFGSWANGIYKLSNDKVTHFSREQLAPNSPNKVTKIRVSYVDSAGRIYFYNRNHSGLIHNSKTKLEAHSMVFESTGLGPHNSIWGLSGNQLYKFDSLGNKVLISELDELHAEMPYEVLKCQQHTHLVVNKRGDGVYFYDYQDLDKAPEYYLQGIPVSNSLVDHEGNLWISSLNNGVYMYASEQNYYFPKHKQLSVAVHSLEATKSCLYVGTANGELICLGRQQKVVTLPIASTKYVRIADILLAENELWLATDKGVYSYNKLTEQIKKHIEGSAKCLLYKNESLYVGNYHSLTTLNLKTGESSTILNERCLSLLEHTNGSIWAGTNNGLFLINNNQAQKIPLSANNAVRINDLAQQGNNVLIATHAKGVIVYNNGIIGTITQANGLASNVISAISTVEPTSVWIAGNKGIVKVTTNELWTEYKLHTYKETNGLPSNFVSDILLRDDTIWVASDQGLSFFKEEEQYSHQQPVYITKVSIKQRDTTVLAKYILPYKSNSISIGFTAVSFTNGSQLKFKYRLKGLNNEWHHTENRNVEYPFLPPGNYTFEVTTTDINGIESSDIASFVIVVRQPFWKTESFAWIIVLALVALILTTYALQQRNFRRKQQIEDQLLTLRQKALKAQINPHFVSNCLNSIQELVFSGAILEANEYLSKFSGMMRLVLDSSDTDLVSLQSEIKLIKSYLELEALRFKGRFEYKVSTNLTNMESILIPSMIVQPLVENAVKHGVLSQERIGKINVLFSRYEGQIECRVSDNGLGINTQANRDISRNTTKRKSYGLRLTKQRLNLLKAQKRQIHDIEVIDYSDIASDQSGTLVILKMPEITRE